MVRGHLALWLWPRAAAPSGWILPTVCTCREVMHFLCKVHIECSSASAKLYPVDAKSFQSYHSAAELSIISVSVVTIVKWLFSFIDYILYVLHLLAHIILLTHPHERRKLKTRVVQPLAHHYSGLSSEIRNLAPSLQRFSPSYLALIGKYLYWKY